jgi:hypothetical protein
MSSHLDMVVGSDAGTTPLSVLIGLGRQRHQGRPIDGLEELATTRAELAHEPCIELVDQHADGRVQLDQREETPVAQPRQNPALDDENRRLDLGLVARLARARRQDGRAVMAG